MKITEQDKEITTKLKFTIQNLKDLRGYALYGIPKEDKKGHTRFFNVRVQPVQMDMIEGIKERLPGWYKSNSQLYRSIIASGTYVVLKVLEKDIRTDDLKSLLHDLNYIETQFRIKDLKDQRVQMKRELITKELPRDTKDRIVNLLEKIEKRYKELLK